MLRSILPECWSVETSSLWLPENPARGQCDVTSLAAHDIFGGEILKTRLPARWHFYNWIGADRHDLTDSQFASSIIYDDARSTREEALAGATLRQYTALRNSVARRILALRLRERPSSLIRPTA
ncbi:hypothetical protein FF100_02495 [Methylobacterium terricola]|uniref:Uncharacterized protein n=1 Tax=Methylobacterium terricola TaxID=2583531 RepID=A0A5C4LTZ0_9HYPH|nr:hypothetical protein FF100_02495 [Methylobacterium terricola]